MKKSYKVRLKTNKTLENQLFQFLGASRYAYNWAIVTVEEYYKENKSTISESDLRKLFTLHKKETGKEWTKEISNDVFKQGIRDCYDAYRKFFKKLAKKPKFKKKFFYPQSFYIDVLKIKFIEDSLKPEKLPWIKLCEKNRIPLGVKYYNPRVIYDGRYFYITVSVDVEPNTIDLDENLSIGIDLGIKTFATIAECKTDGSVGYYSYDTLKKQIS